MATKDDIIQREKEKTMGQAGEVIGRTQAGPIEKLPNLKKRQRAIYWREDPKGSGNWIQGKHPPMITKNQFLLVQEILSGRSKPRPQKHSFTYAGLFQCGNCGASITPDYKIKKQKEVKFFGTI